MDDAVRPARDRAIAPQNGGKGLSTVLRLFALQVARRFAESSVSHHARTTPHRFGLMSIHRPNRLRNSVLRRVLRLDRGPGQDVGDAKGKLLETPHECLVCDHVPALGALD